jgi:prophage regulatory protein
MLTLHTLGDYAMPDARPLRYLRMKDLVSVVGLSRSTIYAMIREDRFPPPDKVGTRAVRWLSSDIDAWIAGRRQDAMSGTTQ